MTNEESTSLEKLINEREAAQLLGISVQTLRNDRSMQQGCPYIKFHKHGSRGTIRYRRSDIERYILCHRVQPLRGYNRHLRS